VLYLGGATLFGYKPDWISGALAAVASLLPDIDLPPARIGRLFWFVAVPLERRFGHRTLTHSALMLLAVAALAAPLGWINPLYYWAIIGGYGSRLWLDMLNIRRIDLFWPSPLRVVTPGNRHGRLEVGSQGEMILLSGLLVAATARGCPSGWWRCSRAPAAPECPPARRRRSADCWRKHRAIGWG
jgi:inner membrane protein